MPTTYDEDAVRLKLAGVEVPIVVDYEVHSGVMQPAQSFTMTVGHGGVFASLAAIFPPRTPFELLVQDTVVASGETDGYSLGGSDATVMKIAGRDILARLIDTQIDSEQTFGEATYADLTKLALQKVGLGDRQLFLSNTANRKAITAVKGGTELGPPPTEETQTEAGQPIDAAADAKKVYKTIKGEVGHSWFEFLTTQNKRAGLFMWATANGGVALTRPNGNQQALYRIIRRLGTDSSEVSVVDQPDFHFDISRRHSEYQVYGRMGGGKKGRNKVVERVIDWEMVKALNREPANRADGGKIRKPQIIKDNIVRTPEQAQFLCRRKMVEERRDSWSLTYRVAGHTTPALIGGGRAIWAPDTVVEVIDDELGIEGHLYIESIKRTRTPHTITEIRLMRCEDLLFAEEDDQQPTRLRRGPPPAPPDPKDISYKLVWTTDPNIGKYISASIRGKLFVPIPPKANIRNPNEI